jgi:SAM-dependent methyltransferase
MELEKELDQFIESIPLRLLTKKAATATNENEDHVFNTITTFVNEARTSLNLIKNELSHEVKILEVGSGLCFFSLFLKKQGFNITALEPASGGFNLFNEIKNIILEYFSHLSLPVLELSAEELTHTHGQFDLIFSSNVIEHIPELNKALDSMLHVLAPGGKMIHGCPNYLIPYEPHFGIPVIIPLKNVSALIFKKKIRTMNDMWESLNFITYLKVRRYAQNNELVCSFRKSILYETLIRLDKDPHFKQRHSKGLFLYIYNFLKYTGILSALKYLPPSIATPMIFELRK